MNNLIKFLSTPGGLICAGAALIALTLLAQSLTGGFFYLLVALAVVALLGLIINVVWHLLDEPLLRKIRRHFEKSE
jgi:hypothetical protein